MLKDYILETSNAPGTTTTINLAGVVAGRKSFASSFSTGAVLYYYMDDGTQAEYGQGTFTTGSPNTLTRTTVFGNTAGTTARLNFAGVTNVYNSLPASRVPYVDSTSTVSVPGSFVLSGNNFSIYGTDTGAVSRPLLQLDSSNWTNVWSANSGSGVRVLSQGGSEVFRVSNGGAVAAVTGYTAKSGTSGGYRANMFNIDWNGSSANLYIDATNIGAFSFVSDPRVKQNIVDAPGGSLERVMSWHVVEYEFANVGIFQADGVRRLGFLTTQLHAIDPRMVVGEVDAVDETGGVVPQTLNLPSMLAEAVKALQESAAVIADLTSRITALEAR